MDNLGDWASKSEQLNTTELDALMNEYVNARADYDEKKKVSNEAHAKAEEIKKVLIVRLQEVGKEKWETDLGKVSLKDKYSVKMPKDVAGKQKLFDFLKRNLEPEEVIGLLTINSRTYQSFYNEYIEEHPTEIIPGVGEPTFETTISLRKVK